LKLGVFKPQEIFAIYLASLIAITLDSSWQGSLFLGKPDLKSAVKVALIAHKLKEDSLESFYR
jgi:hypothetical protein